MRTESEPSLQANSFTQKFFESFVFPFDFTLYVLTIDVFTPLKSFP